MVTDSNEVLFGTSVCDFWKGAVFFQGVCYNLVDSVGWSDAQASCGKSHIQAVLAETTTPESRQFLSEYIKEKIGATDVYVGGSYENEDWKWIYSGHPVLTSDGEPFKTIWNNPLQCLQFDAGSTFLETGSCNLDFNGLCQIDIGRAFCNDENSFFSMGSCYTFMVEPMVFETAQTTCEASGGRLAELPGERFALASKLIDIGYRQANIDMSLMIHIGGKRDNSLNIFKWISTGTKIDSHWLAHEPHSIIEEQCLGLADSSGLVGFRDFPCTDDFALFFFCETVFDEQMNREPIDRYVSAFPGPGSGPTRKYNVNITVSRPTPAMFGSTPVVAAFLASDNTRSKVWSFSLNPLADTILEINERELILLKAGTYTNTLVLTSFKEAGITVSVTYHTVLEDFKFGDPLTSYTLQPIPVTGHNNEYYVIVSTASCNAIAPVAGSTEPVPNFQNVGACFCLTHIAAIAVDEEQVTKVTFEFMNRDTDVIYETDIFTVENPKMMTVNLEQYQVVYIRSRSDLSGTYIKGTSRLAVIVGYSALKSVQGSSCRVGHSYTQVRSTSQAAKEYVSFPSSGGTKDRYRVVALQPTTEISVYSNVSDPTDVQTITFTSAGDVREFVLSSDQVCVINSSKVFMAYKLSFSDYVECLTLLPSDNVIPPSAYYSSTRQTGLNSTEINLVAKYDIQQTNVFIDDMHYSISVQTDASGTWHWSRLTLPSNWSVFHINGGDVGVTGVLCEWMLPYGGFCTEMVASTIGQSESQDYVTLTSYYFRNLPTHELRFGFDVPFEMTSPTISPSSMTSSSFPSVTSLPSTIPKTTLSKIPNSPTSPSASSTSENGINHSPTTEKELGSDAITTNRGSDITAESTTINYPLHEPKTTETVVNQPKEYLISNSTTCIIPITPNFTTSEVKEIVQEIQKKLSVNTKTVSSFIRAKTSAQDDRPSSQAVGMLGIAMISFALGLVVLPDMISVCAWFARVCNTPGRCVRN